MDRRPVHDEPSRTHRDFSHVPTQEIASEPRTLIGVAPPANRKSAPSYHEVDECPAGGSCIQAGPIAALETRLDEARERESVRDEKIDAIHAALRGDMDDAGVVGNVRVLLQWRTEEREARVERRKMVRSWLLGLVASLILVVVGMLVRRAESSVMSPPQHQQQK
jgi:hypothetical protein